MILPYYIEVVPSAKLLGVIISNDLKWNVHVEMICKKVAARLYFLRQLSARKCQLMTFYVSTPLAYAQLQSMHVQSFIPLYRNISPIS